MFFHTSSRVCLVITTRLQPFSINLIACEKELCCELGVSPAEAVVKNKLVALKRRRDMPLLSPRNCFLMPAPGIVVLLARVSKFDATISSYGNGLSALNCCGAVCSDLLKYIYIYIYIYNLLPQQIIDETS